MTAASYSCPSCGMAETVYPDEDGLLLPGIARRRLDFWHNLVKCPGKRNDFQYHSGFAITQGKDA